MDINDCIHDYGRLYTEVFEHGSAPLRFRFSRNARNEQFEKRLRSMINDIVHRRLPRKYGPEFTNIVASEEVAFAEDRCRT